MEKLSEGSEFGMADNVEAEVVKSGKVLKDRSVDNMSDGIGMSDSVTAEVNP
jgi:hypothetical protein